MKLVRYAAGSGAAWGLLAGEEILRLAAGDERELLGTLAAGATPLTSGESTPLAGAKLLAPAPATARIFCVGLNYRAHADETKLEAPSSPVVFTKFASSLTGTGQDVVVPDVAKDIDWEAELAVVIGRQARDVSQATALEVVAGYANLNDVSSRSLQFNGGGQWTLGKALDGFAPMGPWLVAKDEVPNPQALSIRCEVDGAVMQAANTADMIFGVAELIAFLSRHLMLLPGDVIATGTPQGVALGRTPPPYLRSGAQVTVEIEKLGRLSNTIVC